MSKSLFKELEKRINNHSYMSGVNRSIDRVRFTAEIFTPTSLVVSFLKELPKDSLALEKSILDPACGDGQFLDAVKWYRILKYEASPEDSVKTLYGIDIMRDNVSLCSERLGGGIILMGDALQPAKRLKGQTEEEYFKLNELLDNHLEMTLFN
jgi:hypothetical protein